jgi:hypothetical protein
VLLDYDARGASAEIAERVEKDGLWPTLIAAIP